MRSEIVNRTRADVSTRWVKNWLTRLEAELKRRKIVSRPLPMVCVAFVTKPEIQRLNFQFRKKDYPTDILSFSTPGLGELGELVISPAVIRKQAKEHGLSVHGELGYMLIHGVLHLLGYDHEKNAAQARRMFKIQDDLYAQMCKTSAHVTASRIRRRKKKP